MRAGWTRRGFLRSGSASLLGLAATPGVAKADSGADSFGPLRPPDANGLRLPPGFHSRVVATSNAVVPGTTHTWHAAPDGGACFATLDGGWVYVSNSERFGGNGGVGAIRFASDGHIVDAYDILSGTQRNCAGGATPWRTWLSCEETPFGQVYECDPFGAGSQGKVRPALGKFSHEAVAVDTLHQTLYLTEDVFNGRLYRFSPQTYPDVSAGVLEAAEILDPCLEGPIVPGEVRPLAWHAVPDPTFSGSTPTRLQVPNTTPFNGGEGCDFEASTGLLYFSTKGDDRIWMIDTVADTIEILYDKATSSNPILSNVDNVMVTPCGDVLVAEDPGDLQIVSLSPSGAVKAIDELDGVKGPEITGPALSPDGTRLYFSSQRNPGQTFEVTGPFTHAPAVPAAPALVRVGLAAILGVAGAFALRRRSQGDA